MCVNPKLKANWTGNEYCMPAITRNRLIEERCEMSNTITSLQYQNTFVCLFVCLFSWRYNPLWLYFYIPVACSSFLDHIQRRVTVGRTPLDEWSARRRDLYLTTHNTHSRQTSMPPVGFEPTISAGERPKIHALDHAALSERVWQ